MLLMGVCKGWGRRHTCRASHQWQVDMAAPWVLVRFQVLLLSAVGISVMLAADLPPKCIMRKSAPYTRALFVYNIE